MKKKSLYVSPLFYSIGNAAEEILWAYTRAAITEKKLKILYPYNWTQILNYKICNIEIFKLKIQDESKLENFQYEFINFLFNILFFGKRFINIIKKKYFKSKIKDSWNFLEIGHEVFWPLKNGVSFKFDELKRDSIINSIHGERTIKLDAVKEKICINNLKKYGICNDEKFICIHVRESGFHNDSGKRNYRNADISNYHSAIRFLIERGFIVFRMGDNTMQKLKINNPKIIDYPFTNLKSELMDIYLIKNCEFFIGMQSGILDVALLFNKPTLTLNMYDWFFTSPLKVNDRGMLKKIKIKQSDEILNLTFKEQFDLPYYYTNAEIIQSDNIEFIEHAPDEILRATQEFLEDYNSNFKRERNLNLIDNMNLFRVSSDEILLNYNKFKSYNFYSHTAKEVTRLTLRNLSTRGVIYDYNH